ncbi:PQQ-binding-like beta-propeller repeat protein [Mucilaginibacter aquariorum]|uniref:PQQ-binding-like beta-propeller repeat protein n=1 Tax=Mucilaginibacter aquariorum TaxID=2967225 RepID=A0ABT1T451_9SPHI|nr:PQQ-binding-like beta-propeller repeat protein [Mucilaginibacter aquariorum]MCQ6959344.1 PQQ-binding-like beta-propeller repeat protein [Mucilaginibacter aquariorum]
MKKIIGLPLMAAVLVLACACNQKKDYRSWPQYKGSNENIHYSSLTEVDTTNVKQLQVAWTYHTRDADSANHSQIQCNPIVVDGTMYGTTPKMKLFAIDAATGKEKWQFNPFDSLAKDKRMFFIMNNSRGVAYWGNEDDKRIFYTAGSYLYCINATTGKTVNSFGDKGKLDLHDGLGRDVKDLFVTASSPPIIYNDILITGTRVDEGQHAAPGHIRAYNVRTGKQLWIFHTIPYPGEDGYESWDDPNAYKFIGGANVWSGFSMDVKRGIVYGCTGSASYDWYGGKRLGNNLYADCLLALDAKSGKLIWHFQDVHHDVWDRDIPSAPALVTIKKDGIDIDAVAITTKSGFVFTFNRDTGLPVYDILEKPVPTFTDLVGEKLSPTQPYPTLPAPFMRQLMTEKEINPYLPDSSKQQVLKALRSYKNDHMFNAPSLQGTVVFPGLDGGAEWGGPSYDPETGILYINANQMAWVIQAIPIQTKAAANETNLEAGQRLFKASCMTCHGVDRKGSGTFPSLININKKYSTASFDTLLQSGRRMMPAFRQLKAVERKAIASFILNVKAEQHKPFVDADSHKDDPFKVPYSIVGYNKFLSKEGYPAISPPWGTLNAIDLNTGKYVWKQTLGNDPEFPHGKEQSGTENYGASVITKGGLLFIAATKDGKFRAFNKKTGKLLWEVTLPAPGYATPSIYEISGKQYIVIACGGGKMNTRSGDSFVAFALPN